MGYVPPDTRQLTSPLRIPPPQVPPFPGPISHPQGDLRARPHAELVANLVQVSGDHELPSGQRGQTVRGEAALSPRCGQHAAKWPDNSPAAYQPMSTISRVLRRWRTGAEVSNGAPRPPRARRWRSAVRLAEPTPTGRRPPGKGARASRTRRCRRRNHRRPGRPEHAPCAEPSEPLDRIARQLAGLRARGAARRRVAVGVVGDHRGAGLGEQRRLLLATGAGRRRRGCRRAGRRCGRRGSPR